MKILITSAAATLSHRLKNKLGKPDILLGDYAELPELMLKSGIMIKLPSPTDASYAHKMLTICLDNSIEVVYALQKEEFILLIEANLLFNEYGITISKGNEI